MKYTKIREGELKNKVGVDCLNNFDTTKISGNIDFTVFPKQDNLLVPQDIRERKGAFFTPRKWVELSQKYITDYLGKDWQDEYYIWDCAAGTGNLLAGLTNKYNIYASTLDQSDVNAMNERIDHGANLLKNHVFQFDFLNDDFTKLPQSLQDIINDEEKRKKLVIYINPPYAESNSKNSVNRSDIGNSKIYTKYENELEKVAPELFTQFLIRIYKEIPQSIITQFSTLKAVSASNSKVFRSNFCAKLKSLFIVPANTFDNVTGDFPIGFFIWDTTVKEIFKEINAAVYNADGNFVKMKNIYSYDKDIKRINNWLPLSKIDSEKSIGCLMADAPDFQNNNFISILNKKSKRHGVFRLINESNLIIVCVYLAVRHCIKSTWLNDRDQFLFPSDNWQIDKGFYNDCLAFSLFHGQNKIKAEESVNKWIPFTEQEVNAKEKFDSNFMTDFINGKIKPESSAENSLFESEVENKINGKSREFSPEATAVFDAGRELWRYYHSQENVNVNASFYDIRAHFQGRNEKGRMNLKSDDKKYMELIGELRTKLKILAKKIEPKVYEYGFLQK